MIDAIKKIAVELQIAEPRVASAVQLLFEELATIPFIARYRKEKTGSLDEVELRTIRDRYAYIVDLEKTKVRYLKVVEELAKTKPDVAARMDELRAQFKRAETKQELEDLYLPFKPKRRTRAMMAKEKGLEPLADAIMAQLETLEDLSVLATPFTAAVNPEMGAQTVAEALAGAADILAERVAETAEIRQLVRQTSTETGCLVSTCNEALVAAQPVASAADDAEGPAGSKKGDSSKYENYFDYREPLSKTVSHRIMAIRRGEAEKVLRVSIEVDDERIMNEVHAAVLGGRSVSPGAREWFTATLNDAYKRLIAPSIETEIRLELKSRAEGEAIQVFSKNTEKLLLLPPLPGVVVCGVDPGLRTGSKFAVISPTGKLLAYETVYPDYAKSDAPKTKDAREKIRALLHQHAVQYIAIGNGTGSNKIDPLIQSILEADDGLRNIRRVIVSESGASVYSTDDIAREEFPDLDPTIRSAISIARRLQDPLAELVKIDPRSIGVGQYQHDCDVNRLNESLQDSVESCVNRVGVNLNTASYKLLSYVSGIGASRSKAIVQYRDTKGGFKSRDELQEVPGLGARTFEQAAGFLRVVGGGNPLDNSSVHPERYELVQRIARDRNLELTNLVGNKDAIAGIPWENYVSDDLGMPTLLDIAKELEKPGRDPREDGTRRRYSGTVSALADLKLDMKLQGTVSNVTAFGAFVDIGVHQDGLVHISELSDQFVSDPSKVVSVGDQIEVRVIAVDLKRKRISLSCKTKSAAPAVPPPSAPNQPQNRPQPSPRGPRPSFGGNGQQPNQNNRPRNPNNDMRGGNGPRPSNGARDANPNRGRGGDDRSGARPNDHRGSDQRRPPRPKVPEKQHSVGDLLAKFNNRA